MTVEEIKNIIKNNKVVVFGKGEKHKPMCGFTANMQNVFDKQYPEYEMVNILGKRSFQKILETFSNWPTFPQIYINGEFIGGGDIILEMNETTELKDLLQK
jgi:monothiol glutaredoxin